ncbi:hypothetical protein [Catenuloplanes atrovinosus]|uniref:Uncharacterized protein n=1 Tax=Catenuloplanes atrovinosus TaxID=137266 RepID=A0AAE3YVU5_9ACTN|nr:hypothetical protein [Catenuloplanes atrovinosus]MDR7280823.1 hypothetical protein [Catenuloplanes atrovinosus]
MSRTSAGLRQVLLGAVAGAAVFAVAWAASSAVVFGLGSLLWPESPDANIGAGLILLAIPAAVIPLALWAALRALRVPAAALIGAGGIVVYVLAVQIGTGQSAWEPVYLTAAAGTAVFAIYAGLATALAGAITSRREA